VDGVLEDLALSACHGRDGRAARGRGTRHGPCQNPCTTCANVRFTMPSVRSPASPVGRGKGRSPEALSL
jgi:hypothetical protein